MWRGLLKHLFFTPLRHQISNWVSSQSLTKPLAVSMNEHGSKPLAIFPFRQNKHPGFQSSARWEAFSSPCPAGHPWVCSSTCLAHGSLSTGPHNGIPHELPTGSYNAAELFKSALRTAIHWPRHWAAFSAPSWWSQGRDHVYWPPLLFSIMGCSVRVAGTMYLPVLIVSVQIQHPEHSA